MDFLRKCHVKSEISIYCDGIFKGKKNTKKLSKSGSGNAQKFLLAVVRKGKIKHVHPSLKTPNRRPGLSLSS